MEVIADEYFFTPARGEVSLVAVKDVEFTSKSKKPSVSASFKVSQDDAEVKESFSAAAASSGGATAGGTSPNTALLTPETNPDEEELPANPGMYDVTPDEEPGEDDTPAYSASIIISHDVPGESDISPAEFDAKQVAHSIIKSKMGNMTRPDKPGTLFNRLPGGKAVVQGLESPDLAREIAQRDARVKEILKLV